MYYKGPNSYFVFQSLLAAQDNIKMAGAFMENYIGESANFYIGDKMIFR